jgi:hypothetical protein
MKKSIIPLEIIELGDFPFELEIINVFLYNEEVNIEVDYIENNICIPFKTLNSILGKKVGKHNGI